METGKDSIAQSITVWFCARAYLNQHPDPNSAICVTRPIVFFVFVFYVDGVANQTILKGGFVQFQPEILNPSRRL